MKGDRARKRRTLSSVVETEDFEDQEDGSEERDDDEIDDDESNEEQVSQPTRHRSPPNDGEDSSQDRPGLEEESDELETENLPNPPRLKTTSYNAIRKSPQPGSTRTQNVDRPKRKGKGKPRQSDISMHEESQVSDRRSINTVPIVVHRLRAPSLEEDGDDTAPLKGSIVRRGGVNAVDVLSQTCKEMMSKTITLLKQEQEKEMNNVKKGEWRRKRKIVEAFGDELDIRCYDLVGESLDSEKTGLMIAYRQRLWITTMPY